MAQEAPLLVRMAWRCLLRPHYSAAAIGSASASGGFGRMACFCFGQEGSSSRIGESPSRIWRGKKPVGSQTNSPTIASAVRAKLSGAILVCEIECKQRESVITRLRMVATHRNSSLLQAINYARLFKIVRRHLKLYAITNRKTNESLPHFPT